MLHLINKFAPFIAIGVIGYLAYSSFESTGLSLAGEEKEVPSISAKLLSPKFIEPVNHASPANRDPFVIGTDSRFTSAYLNGTEGTNKNSGGENTVDFPERLMGIFTGSDGQSLAMIGTEVYSVGSPVVTADANQPWRVSAIGEDKVILTCNGAKAVLKISNDVNDFNDVRTATSEQIESKGNKSE